MLQNLNKRVDNHASMPYNKNMEQTSNQHGHQSDGHESSNLRIFNVTNCNNIFKNPKVFRKNADIHDVKKRKKSRFDSRLFLFISKFKIMMGIVL